MTAEELPPHHAGHTNGVVTPAGPYGFPGATFEIAYCDLALPEDDLSKSHYDGFHPSSQILPKGHIKAEGFGALPCDLQYDRDVALQMRDGTTVYTDVFRPPGDVKVPAILSWSPYGKTGTGYMYYDTTGPYYCGITKSSLSGYHKFEGPDPAEWALRGYAVINIDARGSFNSEGHMMRWGPQEALDVYDTCEWLTKQSWCNGSIGMCGNSWLAVSQINAAARDPHPALKCIAPWEGHSDHFRDVMTRGGIPQTGFGNWMQGVLIGRGKMEDTAKQVAKYPLFNDYWETKRIPVENINIPTYQLASYSSFIHTRGSLETFRNAKTTDKWLRIHNAQEWADLYKTPNVNDLNKFYDRYLKGIDNGWERDTPRVRLTMISFTGNDVIERPENEYPLARQEFKTFHLDATDKTLKRDKPTGTPASDSYDSHHLTDCLDFELKVDEYVEIAGYPVLKVWAQCKEHDDMDIRIQLRKKSADGKLLYHLNYASLDGVEEGYDQDVNIFKFLGSTGMLRASHRASYKEEKSTFNEPWYHHDRREPVEPGSIIPLTIGIWPTGMVLSPGESLVLRIAGHSLVLPEFRELKLKAPIDENKGRHVIHTGGEYDSTLVLPIINGAFK